ncbi:MAG: HlyC/CorC family transporter [Alphaproteobacteria bacterium]|nr:MAG: HlyC/CorC family transporter [Alphaproteobacteria bacterium]
MNDNSPASSSTTGDGESSSSLLTWLKRIFSGRNGEGSLRESLEEVIGEHESAFRDIGAEQRALLLNTLAFAEKRVDDIMIPRADIVAVEIDTAMPELVKTFCNAAVSRMPVYRGTLDDVLAMVHIKDVFRAVAGCESPEGGAASVTLEDIKRPVLFVPPSMRLPDLLVKMRATRLHLAVVVDEYGGTDGLVTIEDLVEQIVGEIEDEHDLEEDTELRTIDENTFEAGARLEVAELEQVVGVPLLTSEHLADIDTVGGLVVALAGRVPHKGEVVHHDAVGLSFKVLDADPRRLRKILIRIDGGHRSDG